MYLRWKFDMSKKGSINNKKEKGKTLKERGYKQVSLPIRLVEHVEKYMNENPHLGFTSIPDFIRAAIRKKMNL